MPVRELPFDRSTIGASAMDRSIDVPNASHVVTTDSCRVEQLDERGEKAWEGYVSEHPEGTIFLTFQSMCDNQLKSRADLVCTRSSLITPNGIIHRRTSYRK